MARLDRVLQPDGSWENLEYQLQTTYWWKTWPPIVVVFAVVETAMKKKYSRMN